MLKFCIDEVKKLHATQLILYSNSKLQPAIHLYREFRSAEISIGNPEYQGLNIKRK
jgi:hypothetical protein